MFFNLALTFYLQAIFQYTKSTLNVVIPISIRLTIATVLFYSQSPIVASPFLPFQLIAKTGKSTYSYYKEKAN